MGLAKCLTFPRKVGQKILSVVSTQWYWASVVTVHDNVQIKRKSCEHFEVVQMTLGVLRALLQGVALGKSVHHSEPLTPL